MDTSSASKSQECWQLTKILKPILFWDTLLINLIFQFSKFYQLFHLNHMESKWKIAWKVCKIDVYYVIYLYTKYLDCLLTKKEKKYKENFWAKQSPAASWEVFVREKLNIIFQKHYSYKTLTISILFELSHLCCICI